MNTCLVLGDANCVDADIEAALAMFEPDAIAACNNIGIRYPGKVDHWFTLHPDPAPDWVGLELARQQRVRAGRNNPITWAHKDGKGVDKVMRDHGMGSTGLFAVLGMLTIGYERIVLAGVPMTSEGAHYYSSTPWTQATRYYRGWLKYYDELRPCLRSMSGWTKEQFGFPTLEWLEPSKHPERKYGNAETTSSP